LIVDTTKAKMMGFKIDRLPAQGYVIKSLIASLASRVSRAEDKL
jgi:hypothetical protein